MTSPEVHHVDSSEEDAGCYFLQPASHPYNIADKVHQANMDLFNATLNNDRTTKVKFRDDLVSYEPDLTDDDVNSIESDQVDELPEEISDNNDVTTYTTVLREGLEVEEEAVVEELVLSDEEVTGKQECGKKAPSPRTKKRRKTVLPKHQEVHCKEHCIEKIEADLSMCVRKLDIHEKPNRFNLPPLQLHQRKCCDDVKLANLPHYNGYRSEYGLTSRQIKTRDRYVEMIRQKEMARQKVIEEYRALKMRQNEAVFCQWLREVSKRREKRGSVSSASESRTERPKTAGFVPKTAMKKRKVKRPISTQSCVYIQLSPNMLTKGVHVGDLMITNSKELSRKLHILTVS